MTTRSIKLVAYAIFAVVFPFWIFLGQFFKQGEVNNNKNTSDTVALKLIEVLSESVKKNAANNGDTSLAAAIKDLARSNEKADNILDLVKDLLSKPVTPANSRISFSNIPVDVRIRYPDTPVRVNQPMPKSIADSVEEKIGELYNETQAFSASMASDSLVLVLYNLNPDTPSTYKELDFTKYCADSLLARGKRLSDKIQTLENYINNSKKNSLDSAAKTSDTILLNGLTKTLNQLGTQDTKSYYIGLKNNTAQKISLSFEDTTKTMPGLKGINFIQKQDTFKTVTLQKGDIAYYEIKNNCSILPRMVTFYYSVTTPRNKQLGKQFFLLRLLSFKK